MIEDRNQEITGVICLYCGMNTPLPNPPQRACSNGELQNRAPEISLVRCRVCGKEAPYLAHEIVVFQGSAYPGAFDA